MKKNILDGEKFMPNSEIKQFTLSVANVRQKPQNTEYPNITTISNAQELADAVKFDCVVGTFKNNHRCKDNFIETDCFIMDMDNDKSDNPEDWITPAKFREKLPGVYCYVYPSKSNMKVKKGKSPRPKFHVVFFFERKITSANEITAYQRKLLKIIPEFDTAAFNPEQYFDGVENPEITYFDGNTDIITFLDAIPDSEPNLFATTSKKTSQTAQHTEARKAEAKSEKSNAEIIPEGGRNAELYSRGLDIIAKYADINEAKNAFWQECKKCSPMLDNDEYRVLWQHIENSDTKKLADMARCIGDRQKFISEAEAKKFDKAIILTVAKVVFSNPTAPISKAVSEIENAPVMSELDALISLAQEILIKYSNLNKARELFEQTTNGNFDAENINNAWNEALISIPVKLASLARNMKENREGYISLAKGVTDDSEAIAKIWNKVNEKKTGGGFKIEKQQVNVNVVFNALNKLGVTVRLNVISQKKEFIGVPNDPRYVLENFSKLSQNQQKRTLKKHMTGILLPLLRDEGYIVTSADIDGYLDHIADNNQYNPLEEMFKSQKWDGVDRVRELQKLMHIENNEYYCMLVRKWLHQCVAMALNDNGDYNNEFILTLYGPQGCGKTTLPECLALKNEEWFAEGVDLDVNNKEEMIRAQTHWLVELGEVEATIKHEQAQLKNKITAKRTNYRVWYGRDLVDLPLRTSYIATVNKEKFLKDIAGGTRRWAIICVTKIEHETLRNLPKDWFIQLWAQVYKMFMANPKGYRLTPEEKITQEKYNKQFAEFLRGEVEIIEHLDWNADISTWKYITASAFLTRTKLDRILKAKDVREALDKLADGDKRIKIKTKTKQGKQYLLPPTLDLTNTTLDENDNDTQETANENIPNLWDLIGDDDTPEQVTPSAQFDLIPEPVIATTSTQPEPVKKHMTENELLQCNLLEISARDLKKIYENYYPQGCFKVKITLKEQGREEELNYLKKVTGTK